MSQSIPKILSLDGGGVRGLSSLLILRDIMEEVQKAEDKTEMPKPCDYFDLICGTSTGGLIAIMLGLLGMVIICGCVRADSRVWTSVLNNILNYRRTFSMSTMSLKERFP